MRKKKITNYQTLESYISKGDWKQVYKEKPISGLSFRNNQNNINFGCVASGIFSYQEGIHNAGIDNISYSLQDNIWKVDRYALYPTKDKEEFEIKIIKKSQYSEIHHINEKGELLKIFPILKDKDINLL